MGSVNETRETGRYLLPTQERDQEFTGQSSVTGPCGGGTSPSWFDHRLERKSTKQVRFRSVGDVLSQVKSCVNNSGMMHGLRGSPVIVFPFMTLDQRRSVGQTCPVVSIDYYF